MNFYTLNFEIFIWTFQNFAGWALTEGQHRPKAGKKKKTHEVGLFFLVPLRECGDASSRSGLTQLSPHSNIAIHSMVPFIPFHNKQFNGAGRIARAGQTFEIFKVSLAKRLSERLTLGTLNFEILLWTFQF